MPTRNGRQVGLETKSSDIGEVPHDCVLSEYLSIHEAFSGQLARVPTHGSVHLS